MKKTIQETTVVNKKWMVVKNLKNDNSITNAEGVVNATDTGELKTLTEMGVTSLSLNTTTPYIPTTENTNTIIQETTFTDANGEGVMRDVLFRYENTVSNTEGVYFDMDGNGIKEKMLTWTDPNEWMVVKDLNGDGIINSGREVVGNQMILSNGTKSADTIQALKTFDINHDKAIIKDTPNYTLKSNNNYYKHKIFVPNYKIDIIDNCFYTFKRKAA